MTGLRALPRKNELLSSWLIRSAVLNGTDPIGWCNGIWSDWRPWTTDLDRHIPINRLKELKVFSGLSLERLKDMTLEPIIEHLTDQNNIDPRKNWPWVVPTGERNRNRTNGLHFCPECLAENNAYFKKQWRLSWNIACEQHNCLLALHCSICNTTFLPHLVRYDSSHIYLCTSCGEDLRNIKREKVAPDALALQKKLNEVLTADLESNSSVKNESMEFFLYVREIMMFIRNFRRQEHRFLALINELDCHVNKNILKRTLGSNIDSISVKDREILLSIAASLIKLDQQAITEMLKRHDIAKRVFDSSSTVKSKIGKEILEELCDNNRKRVAGKRKEISILPRTRKEVEKLMEQEIRPFL